MDRRPRANARNANGGRANMKTQRRVNQQQPARNVANKNKKNGGPQKENTGKQQNAPVGFSGVPLSNRFKTLQKEVNANQGNAPQKKNKGNVVVNVKKGLPNKGAKQPKQSNARNAKQQQKLQVQQKQQQKMQQVAQVNRTKRQATVNQRRKGLDAAPLAAKGNNAKKYKPSPASALAGKTKKNAPKKNAAPKQNAAGSKGRPGAKSKDDKKKAAPVTGEDLDIEMDSYWHAAGKGPEPHQALLDRQMDQYWADKPKNDGDAVAEPSEMTSA